MATPELIPLFDLALREDELAAVARVLRSGSLQAGAETTRFEDAFAAHLGCAHAVAVASGTAALHLAYRAAGIGPGDEVIVPSYTFVATAAAAVYCGATPVFADVIGPQAPSIDPAHVAALIGPRTAAVACVHFAGYAAPVHELRALCDRHGLALVEDAAHAPASTAGGAALGTIGDVGCFSLFSNKVLSVGEGGVLCTNDPGIAETARRLRSFDASGPAAIGANYRFDDQRAALAHARLGGLAADVAARRRLTHRYRERLGDLDALTVPFTDAEVDAASCYVMPLMLAEPGRRDALRAALRDRHGVQTSVLYPAVHELTAYRDRGAPGHLAQTERCASAELTIPLFPHLSITQQDRVLSALRSELAPA
jgi:dTDP-4-amino-4,6-dideoxygalactose transaminase